MALTYTTIGSEYLVSQTPWPYTRERNRPWYEPFMMAPFVRQSMWYNLVNYMIDMRSVHAETANFTQRIQPTPDPTELDFRGITLPRQYYDSKSMQVTYKSYGGSVMYHKYDAMIYQWAQRAMENPAITNSGFPNPDLEPIIRGDLATNLVQTLDLVARNAFIASALNHSFASDATGFHDLAATDTFDPDIAQTIKLAAAYMPEEPTGVFPAIISPAAEYSMVTMPQTDNYMQYRQAVQDPLLLNYVAAEYMGITYTKNWRMVLYNVGEVLAQASIVAAVEPGDGAPDPTTTRVDDHWATGSEDATHYIQLSNIDDPSTAETGFKVGDIVTLHRTRPSANSRLATINGVQWNHAQNIDARVVAVDYSTNRISLESPVLNENFYTAISTGLYGWVTKARPVHVSIFFNYGLGQPGVSGVVMDAPKFYISEPADIRKARWEFGWDTYMGYSVTNPEAFSVHFHAGPIVRKNTTGGLQVVNL